MKHIQTLAVSMLLFLLVGCSSSNDDDDAPIANTGVTANSGLIGLWEAETVGVPGLATNVPSPPGDFYLNINGIVGQSINLSVYNKSSTNNCLNLSGPDVLTAIGDDTYQDRAGDTALLLLDPAQDKLNGTFTAGNLVALATFKRPDGVSVSDLQICTSGQRNSVDPDTTALSGLVQAIQ